MTLPQGFTLHKGRVCPLDQANVDTDQIIPKQFLTGIGRTGYGKHLFHDWRYLDQHEQVPNPEFVLNQPQYAGASILLTRENFGCGSSREHAPWALADYGFQVVIAPSFADIFYGNCINNQLLPVVLPSSMIDALMKAVTNDASLLVEVDLQAQEVRANGETMPFSIAEHHRKSLLTGLDAIGETLLLGDKISAFEQAQPHWW